jgi:hypothetical protein
LNGLCADSVEKHEPASDIDTAAVDGLKALDPNRSIRETVSCTAAKWVLFNHLVGGREIANLLSVKDVANIDGSPTEPRGDPVNISQAQLPAEFITVGKALTTA